MKKKTVVAVMLLIISILCGCGRTVVENEQAPRASTGESWTVMIYMCGSEMEEKNGAASEVLKELAYDLPENVHVVIETGGSSEWHTDNIYKDYIQDFAVQKNGIRLISQTASANMGSSGTLRDFLLRSMESYPAEHYMTIIWDHGGGPAGGVAYDSNYQFDSLTTAELKSAFGSLSCKIDIVGFDAGLMSGLETAAALSLYADYMVASEDVMPAAGWDYKSLFDFISSNPMASGEEIGRHICDTAADRAVEADGFFVSMAVTDLSAYSGLAQAFDGLAADMLTAVEDVATMRRLKGAMSNLEYPGGNSEWEGYSNAADIGSLARALKGFAPQSSENLLQALQNTVRYRTVNEYREELSGLSVFVPREVSSEMFNLYIDNCDIKSYSEFLEKAYLFTPSENRSYICEDTAAWQQYNDLLYENTFSAEYGYDNRFILRATHPEIIKSAGVNIYIYDEKHYEYLFLYRDDNAEFDSANRGYVYKISGKMKQFGGNPVSMYKISSTGEYSIYSIPVWRQGIAQNIRAVEIPNDKGKAPEYKILGLWQGIGKYTGMAYRNFDKLEAGDVMTPMYKVYGEDRSKFVEGSKMRMGIGGTKIIEKNMKNGDYLLSYTVEDVYGIEHESNPVHVTVSGRNIKSAQ